MQRIFDIFLSGFALLVLMPLLLPVMVILRLTGEGEVFFAQERIGKGGVSFKLLKFATMLKESPNIGTGTLTLKNDPRILPFGKFLRKAKLNELPQLINILKGDMSIIGPRPQTARCFTAFPENIRNTITKVRPGLSGIGSLLFRNEEEFLQRADDGINFYDEVIAPYKGELEKWYIDNKSMKLYFLIIFTTLWIVISSRYQLVWSLFKGLPEPPEKLAMLRTDVN